MRKTGEKRMKELPNDTRLELEYRVGSKDNMIKNLSTRDSIPERVAWTHGAIAGSHYGKGVLLQLLGNSEEAEVSFSKVVAQSQQSVATNIYEKDHSNQYALFIFALKVGDKAQADESASVISKLGVTGSRYQAPSDIYVVLANLWLLNEADVSASLPSLEKIEKKKNEKYIKSGFVNTVTGVLERNTSLVIDGIHTMLEGHKYEAKYLKYALDHNHFMCEPATVLCILALRYDMDIKGAMEDTTAVLKTKMQEPLDRPEVPEKTKFEVPVDLIPDYILAKWK